MSDKAILAAQLVDVRNVGQHKCIKLTLHVAAEQAGLVMAAFGWPTMVDPVPVAIARLNPDNVKEVMSVAGSGNIPESKSSIDTPPASGPDIQARARKPVAVEKKIAQRVGILCHDEQFRNFLNAVILPPISTVACVTNEEEAADVVRYLCAVKSRSEIIPGSGAADKWDALYSQFIGWRDAPVYIEEPA